MHEDFRKILSGNLKLLYGEAHQLSQKMQHTGYLRHLLVRRAVKTGEILVALVASGQTENLGATEEYTTPVSEQELLAGWLFLHAGHWS